MRALHRRPVNKYKAAKKFRHASSKTKAINLKTAPQRGGFRL